MCIFRNSDEDKVSPNNLSNGNLYTYCPNLDKTNHFISMKNSLILKDMKNEAWLKKGISIFLNKLQIQLSCLPPAGWGSREKRM